MKRVVQFLVEIARIIVGAVFVFSGFVKAIDPLGTTYKIQDYLISFNLTELFPLALPGSVVMVAAEVVLGAFLLLGVYRKWTTIFIALFMIFFIPLTLWIALNNPVADCGCFGDALVITNWQTFQKNVFLLLCTVFLVFKWERMTPIFSKEMTKYVAIFVIFSAIFFTLYNLYRLPVIDFRPYKIGANIPEQMSVDPANRDVFETILIYRKNGVEQEFSQDDFPWDDPAWEYVDMKTVLVRAGERPAIDNFSIEALHHDEATGAWIVEDNITDLILHKPYSFLMVSHSLNKMNTRQLKHFEEINRIANVNNGQFSQFYLLTASPLNVIAEWESRHQTGFYIVHGDERVLKTMIRSNPGLMLLHEGTVVNKWANSEIPTVVRQMEELWREKYFHEFTNKKRASSNTKLIIIGLLFLVPLMIFKWID
ncbi:MAG: DoxX family protein [Dysgonamonadaceae bacterium]|jgi:uncharacterized membrane protein YphA (DoxX/SURF4 family)|nr:DoxX family protein [Dysgonamonadaceae bacterium]